VSARRAALLFSVFLYVLLWVLAFNGATSLFEPLTLTLVLVAMIALGVAFTRFMGLPARQQHFRKPEDGPSP
jgi:ABC-type Fe3+-siderophore transport system permease subunit